MLFDDQSEKKTCKGVPKAVIKNQLTFKKYKNCLFGKKVYRNISTSIASQKQQIKTLVKQKISLSPFDSKHQLFNCGIHGIPYGGVYNNNFECNICIQ